MLQMQSEYLSIAPPRFPGQWFQAESGLHQNWMRDYDPTTGRYLEPDPLGLVDGASVYGYALQSPLRWIDPRGEETLHLGDTPYIDSPNWLPDPSYKFPSGTRWNHTCTNGQITHHDDPQRPHWHYYPEGEITGGRKARYHRYVGPNGDHHLYPPYDLEVPDCPCDDGDPGGNTIPQVIPLILPFMLGPEFEWPRRFPGDELIWE